MSDVNEPQPSGGKHRQPGVDPEGDDPQVAALQDDIERTREQLAETVDQLQAKLDVKARASASAHDVKERATAGAHDVAEKARAQVVDPQGNPRPAALGVAGAVAVGLVAVVVVRLWQRRQARRTWSGRR